MNINPLEQFLKANPLKSIFDSETVNSRNLKTLEVDHENFQRILPQLPATIIKVAESGISSPAQVETVANLGANAVLIGESLVKAGNPVHTIKQLLNR